MGPQHSSTFCPLPLGHTSATHLSPPSFFLPRELPAPTLQGLWKQRSLCRHWERTRRRSATLLVPHLGVHPLGTRRLRKVPSATLRVSAAGVVTSKPQEGPVGQCPAHTFSQARGLASWENPFVPSLHPQPSPDKAILFPVSSTRTRRRPWHRGEKRAWRAPPGAGPLCGPGPWPCLLGSGLQLRAPPEQGSHRTRCSSAGTAAAALQKGGRAAPALVHPRAPRVHPRPADATGLAPPGFLGGSTLPGRYALFPAFAASLASPPQHPRPGALQAGLPNTPAGRCLEASLPDRSRTHLFL